MLEERGINVTYVGITHAIFCHLDPLSQVWSSTLSVIRIVKIGYE